jgi:hypothetical protein
MPLVVSTACGSERVMRQAGGLSSALVETADVPETLPMSDLNLRSMVSIVLPQLKQPSVCEACGNEFTCGATLAGCWCMEVELDDATRAKLREKYNGCLCRACLEASAADGRNMTA